MRILLDTNILVRMAEPGTAACEEALTAIAHLGPAGFQPCIVPQVLYEYWVVCTRPQAQNGLGISTAQASNDIERLAELFFLLRDERAIFDLWCGLVDSHRVAGKNAHDARLVAAMLRHQVAHLLTFNAADFARFGSIAVFTPSQLS